MKRRLVSIGLVLRKDLLTLWPLALPLFGLLLLHPWREDIALLKQGDTSLVTGATLLGSLLFAVIVVQNDSTASTRHDWLTRPIRRFDMAVAKALFLLPTVLVPFVAGEMAYALLHLHYSLGEAMLAAFGNFAIVALALPVLAFACVTGTLVELLIGAVALAVLGFLGGTILEFVRGHIAGSPAIGAEAQPWVGPAGLALLVAGCGVTLWLQYGRRRTNAARGVLLGSIVAVVAMGVLIPPAEPGSGYGEGPPSVRLASPGVCVLEKLISDEDMFTSRIDARAVSDQWNAAAIGAAGPSPQVLAVASGMEGLPPGWTANIDRLDAKALGGGKAFVPHGGDSPALTGRTLATNWLLPQGTAGAGVQFHIEARLTLMKPVKTWRIRDDGRRYRLPGLGYCGTGKFFGGGPAAVRCLSAWSGPGSLSARRVGATAPTCATDCMAEAIGTGLTSRYEVLLSRSPDGEIDPLNYRRLGGEVEIILNIPAGKVLRRLDWTGRPQVCAPPPKAKPRPRPPF